MGIEVGEGAYGLFDGTHGRALGNLDFQSTGVQTRIRQHAQDAFDNAGLPKLTC
ncbi:hypothetical protein SAMN05444515_10910 [Ectothiorhodospira marina]|uniref:Uncharacterized protein n=1 Tax=Ectothiorhodospira marina TaxID=1396821 RepID=A0A1H7M9A7_9GAMM|nr:hypothetical protein SAMN05444515_10910 [Ectothiorhodospira marina]